MRAGYMSISPVDLLQCLLPTAISQGNNMGASKDNHKAVISKADILVVSNIMVNSNSMASNMAINRTTRTTSWKSLPRRCCLRYSRNWMDAVLSCKYIWAWLGHGESG